MVFPAMKMDHEIHSTVLSEALWDEYRHSIIGIVPRSIIELPLVFVAVGTLGVRKRCGCKVFDQQYALKRI